jgi:hypothetical protein
MKEKVMRGYNYLVNRDLKTTKVIEKIFQLRGKNTKKSVEQIIKIVLNSIYGKSIPKPIVIDIKFIPYEKLDNYLIIVKQK